MHAALMPAGGVEMQPSHDWETPPQKSACFLTATKPEPSHSAQQPVPSRSSHSSSLMQAVSDGVARMSMAVHCPDRQTGLKYLPVASYSVLEGHEPQVTLTMHDCCWASVR